MNDHEILHFLQELHTKATKNKDIKLMISYTLYSYTRIYRHLCFFLDSHTESPKMAPRILEARTQGRQHVAIKAISNASLSWSSLRVFFKDGDVAIQRCCRCQLLSSWFRHPSCNKATVSPKKTTSCSEAPSFGGEQNSEKKRG